MRPENTPLVSVVIPTFNRGSTVSTALRSLLRQTPHRFEYEIIVVDDGSTDDTELQVEDVAANSNRPLRYFKRHHEGPASARNLGIRHAQGKIVLFIDDDCIADKELLAEHVKYQTQFKDVIVLGLIRIHPEIPSNSLTEYLENSSEQFDYSTIRHLNKNDLPFCFFYTANISVRKNLLLDAGLFNESYRYAAWEDIDLGFRIKKKFKTPIMFNENALVYHHHPVTITRVMKREVIRAHEHVLFRKINFNDGIALPFMSILYSFGSLIGRNESLPFALHRLSLSLARFIGYNIGNIKYRHVKR